MKDPRFAIPLAAVVGLLLIGGLTWLVTGSWMIAIAVALAIALAVLIVILLRTIRSEEKEERLASGLEDPNGSSRANLAGRSAADPNGIQNVFNQALQDIRSSRLGPEGVSALPWWLILGPDGSGKTELVRSAGLDIPAEFAHSLRSDPTDGCHFVLSNQAVVLDASGRFVDVSDETPENWQLLLRLLKKHRPNVPLEAVVMTLSAGSLLAEDPTKTTELARTLRRRLNEISEGLGFDIPVYFVVTRLDEIRGFAEFISSLPAERTREVFGWTNSQRDVADVAETARASMWPIFDQLDQILPEMLMREPDPERRRNLFLFPDEMRAVAARVVDVLQSAFAPSVYDEVPFLRGVYFTSAKRGSDVLSSVAIRIGHRFATTGAQPPLSEGGIFTSGLFRDVIIGDEDLAVETTSIGRRTRNIVTGLAAAAAIATLAFAGFSFVGNFSSIRDLGAKSQRLTNVPSSLDAADALRESIEAANSEDAAFRFPLLGRTRARASDRATRAFNWAIEREHIRPAKQRLEGILRRSDHDAFEALAVLAMDVSWMASRASGDPSYRPNVVQYTSFDASERDRKAFSNAYDAYVRWAPESELKRQIKEERGSVLESATSLLDLRRLEEWSLRRADRHPPVQYGDFGIDRIDDGGTASVMGAYTRAGWEGLVRDLLRAVEDSGGAADDNIRRFRTGYVTRFDQSWRDFLLDTPSVPEASTAVFESPHLALVERLAREVGSELPRDGRRPSWMDLVLEIRSEEAAASGDEAAAAPEPAWTRYKQALDQVSLDASAITTRTGDSPLELALKMGEAGSFTKAIALLEELIPPRSDTAESRQLRWLLSMPVFDAGRAVLDAAEPELSRRWYEQIYRPYQSGAQDPMSLYDPNGGALTRFMDEELDPFFDRDEPKRLIGPLKLPMSPAFLEWLDEARRLQRILFPGAGAALEIPIRLEGIPSQVMSDPGTYVTRRDLRLDCAASVQTFEYREGTQSETLTWRPDCQRVTLRIWIRPPGESPRELLPRKEWTGPLALPAFLRDANQVSQDRFQWNLEYDDTVVRIEYRASAGQRLLGLEHKTPPSGLRGDADAG